MAKIDIRIPAEFFASPKTRRLQFAAGGGIPGLAAVCSFIQLCTYIRTHGDALNGALQFNGEQDEISLLESEVEWSGTPGAFLKLVTKAGLAKYELNCLRIIDWTETFGSHAQLDKINSLSGTLGYLATARGGGKDTPQYKAVEAVIKQLQLDLTKRSLQQTVGTVGTVGTVTPNKPSEPLEPPDHPDQLHMFDDTHSGNVVIEGPSKAPSSPAPSARNQKPETSRRSPAPPPAPPRRGPDKSDTSKTLNSEQRSGNYDSPPWKPVFKFLEDNSYTQAEIKLSGPFIRDRLKIPFAKVREGPSTDAPLFRLLAQMAIAKQLDAEGKIEKDIWRYLLGCKGAPSDTAQAQAKRDFLKLVDGNGN